MIKKIISLGIFIFCISLVAYPNLVYGAEATISINSKNEEIAAGDLASFSFELDSGDVGIVSIDLIFSYNPEYLEFQDGDTKQTGLQINTTSSSFSTITKKLADKNSGELKFSASKIGGVFNESIIFEASFKALKTGNTSLGIDTDLSKIFNTSGIVTYNFNPLDVEIKASSAGTGEGSSEEEPVLDDETNPADDSENMPISINHSTTPQVQANQELSLKAIITPQSQVKEARLYFKNSIDESFTPLKMEIVDTDTFEAIIPKEKIVIGELKYFFGVIDIDEKPIRHPEEDNIFFTSEILLDNLSADVTPIQTPENNDPLKNYNNYQANFNNTQNTATGPETIFLLIGSVALVLLFITFKDNLFEKK